MMQVQILNLMQPAERDAGTDLFLILLQMQGTSSSLSLFCLSVIFFY